MRWLSCCPSGVARPGVGIYRWRDGGCAIGALLAGARADSLGHQVGIKAFAGLRFAFSVMVLGRAYGTLRALRRPAQNVVAERVIA
jgi:hypothetical protein